MSVRDPTIGPEWDLLKGDELALKWARKELRNLNTVIGRCLKRRVAVQAGGSFGVFPKRLSQEFQTVYTFEPSPELFPFLVLNAPETNIIRFQAALGDTRGCISTAHNRRDGAKRAEHGGLTHVAGPGPIPVLRLDDLALSVCDLIYLDIEGYELFALRGAVDTITRHRPVVAVEVNQNCEYYGVARDDVRQWFTARDYVLIDRQQCDDVFIPKEQA